MVGARELTAPSSDCEELVRSLALAISITLDPMASAPKPEVEPETLAGKTETVPKAPSNALTGTSDHRDAPISGKARAETAPEVDRESEPASATMASSARRLRISLRLGPLLWLGVAPGPAFGGRFGFGAERGPFKLLAEVAQTLPDSIESDLGGSAHVQLTAGSLAPCLTYSLLAGCGVVVLGRLYSYATDVPDSQPGSAFYAAAGGRLEATASLSPSWRLVMTAETVRTLRSVQVHLHQRELWSTSPFAAALSANASFTFQ